MSKEFKPRSWAAPVQDIVKEYDAWDKAETSPLEVQTAPDEFSKSMVRRGVLDPETGLCTGSAKQSTILAGNIRGFSKRGQANYRAIFGHD